MFESVAIRTYTVIYAFMIAVLVAFKHKVDCITAKSVGICTYVCMRYSTFSIANLCSYIRT